MPISPALKENSLSMMETEKLDPRVASNEADGVGGQRILLKQDNQDWVSVSVEQLK